jgi:hypothetical protein
MRRQPTLPPHNRDEELGVVAGITLSEKDKNGRRQREHNRARRFNCVLDCPFGAEQSRQGTRRHRCHEGQSSPGGDKTITELMTSSPTGGCAW